MITQTILLIFNPIKVNLSLLNYVNFIAIIEMLYGNPEINLTIFMKRKLY